MSLGLEISRILQAFPVLETYRLIHEEEVHFRKVHRLLDTFEVYSKLFSVICIQDYVSKIDRDDIDTKAVITFLVNKLVTPSLGTWHEFMHRTARVLANSSAPFSADILGFVGFGTEPERRLLFSTTYREQAIKVSNTQDAFGMLTKMRNDYAHGATPDERRCRDDLDSFLPLMKALLEKSRFLEHYSMALTTVDGRATPHVTNGAGRSLCVYPFVLYEDDGYYFFNNAKLKHKNKLTFLNYSTSTKIIDSDSYRVMREQLPELDVYEDSADFRRQKLLEMVIGREHDAQEIERRLMGRHSSAILYVWGDPGVGKSALAAYVYEHYFNGWIKALHMFFEKDEASLRPESLFKSLYTPLRRAELLPSLELYASNPADVKQNIDRMLSLASESARKTGRRILLIVDGLDEISTLSEPVFHALPSTPPPHICIIYLSRRQENLLSRVQSASGHWTTDFNLGPLGKQAVRAILWQASSKYSLGESLVDVVYERSEGNPLYLSYLVNSLLTGELSLSTEADIPDGMASYYRSLLRTVIRSDPRLPIIDVCLVFSICVEPIDEERVAAILRDASLEHIALSIESLLEVIRPITIKGEKKRYQLFHKSVADFLLENYSSQTETVRRHVLFTEARKKRGVLESWLDCFLSSATCTEADLAHLETIIEQSESFFSIYHILVQTITNADDSVVLVKKIFSSCIKMRSRRLEHFISDCLFALQDADPNAYVNLLQGLSGHLSSSRFLRQHLVDTVALRRFSDAHYTVILDQILKAAQVFPVLTSRKAKIEYSYFVLAIAGLARSFDTFQHLENVLSLLLNLPPERYRGSEVSTRLDKMLAAAVAYLDHVPLQELIAGFRAQDHKRRFTKGNESVLQLAMNFARVAVTHPRLWLKLTRGCGSLFVFLARNGAGSLGILARRMRLIYDIVERSLPLIFTSSENPVMSPSGMLMISRLEGLIKRRLSGLAPEDLDPWNRLRIEARQKRSRLLDNITYLISIALVPLFRNLWNYSQTGLEDMTRLDGNERKKFRSRLRLLKSEESYTENDADVLCEFLSAKDAWRNYFAMVTIIIHGNDEFDAGRDILKRMLSDNSLGPGRNSATDARRRMRILRQHFSIFSYLLRRADEPHLREHMGTALKSGLREMFAELVQHPEMLRLFVTGSIFGKGDPFNPMLPVGIFSATTEHTEEIHNALYLLTDELIRATAASQSGFVPQLTHKILNELLSVSIFYPSLAMRTALHFYTMAQRDSVELAAIALEKIRLLEIMTPGYIQRVASEMGLNYNEIQQAIVRQVRARTADDFLILRIGNESSVFAWHELTTTLMVSCPTTRDLIIEAAEVCFRRPVSISILAESIIRDAFTAYFSEKFNEKIANFLC